MVESTRDFIVQRIEYDKILTLSAIQINTDIVANSVDPDEMAHYEPSHLDLHCLLFWY